MKARFLSLVVSLGFGAALFAPAPLRAQQLIDSTTAIPVFGLAFMVEMYAQDTHLYQKHGVNMKMLKPEEKLSDYSKLFTDKFLK